MNFKNDSPIYLQIVEKIKLGIVRGEYKNGDKLPSVRELSLQLSVNHNTIARVFIELEREGLTETKRGIGTYVRNDDELILQLRREMVRRYCGEFVGQMKEILVEEKDIITALKDFLRDEGME